MHIKNNHTYLNLLNSVKQKFQYSIKLQLFDDWIKYCSVAFPSLLTVQRHSYEFVGHHYTFSNMMMH